jgi:hypothetical protein
MSQIKIRVLKQGSSSEHVISCAFFKMKSAYRDFGKYEHQLKTMIHNSRVLKGFETRIYTDDSAADIAIRIAEKYPDVSVYHFECEPFRDGVGHTGTFGTLVRFLPMFERGLKTVWISDVDVNYQHNWFTNDIVRLASKYDVFAENRICYERRPWNVGKKYPFVAYRMIFNVIFPKRMLTHFITRLMDGSYSDVIKGINDYNIRKTRNDIFPYGMDEYFINVLVYDYIKRKNMKCLFRKDYELSGWFNHESSNLTEKDRQIVTEYNTTRSKKLLPTIKQIYKRGIQYFVEKDPVKFGCFREVLESLDSGLELWFEVDGKDI